MATTSSECYLYDPLQFLAIASLVIYRAYRQGVGKNEIVTDKGDNSQGYWRRTEGTELQRRKEIKGYLAGTQCVQQTKNETVLKQVFGIITVP